MAAEKKSLADKMKPKALEQPAKVRRSDNSVSTSFKSAAEEYPKRLTLDLTLAQHRKLKLRAMNESTSMNEILREFINDLPE